MHRSSGRHERRSIHKLSAQHLKAPTESRGVAKRFWAILLSVILATFAFTISARALSTTTRHEKITLDRANSKVTRGIQLSSTNSDGSGTLSGKASATSVTLEPTAASTSTTVAQTDTASSATLKPMSAGLYLFTPKSTYPFIDHAVIGGSWSEFEPRPGDFSGPGWARIDSALRNYPTYKFRLRIKAGRGAPDWVKNMGGGCVPVYLAWDNISSCIPRFWTDAYLDEYEKFMMEVARRYDDQPRILDVVNSACMTIWAEPFIRAGRDAESNRRLWNAGLNETTDRHCFERSMQIHDDAFTHTRMSLATHTGWQIIVNPATDSDAMQPSWPKERELLNQLRSRYGAKMVVQNNGLGGDEGCAPGQPLATASSMWCWVASAASPKGFQTEGANRLFPYTIYDAVTQALKMDGCFVENYQFGTDLAASRELDSRLKADCPT
jgi:hypothetical protein